MPRILATTTLTAALTAALAAGTAAPAGAAGQWRIGVAGLGTATPVGSTFEYAGELSGTPFAGVYNGTMSALDGSLPAVGECEPGRATLRVEDPRGRYYELVSTAPVCAEFLPLGTMHRLWGRWSVSSTNVKKLARADGHLDIRLMAGQSDVYAADS